MLPSGRICFSGITKRNCKEVADAIKKMVEFAWNWNLSLINFNNICNFILLLNLIKICFKFNILVWMPFVVE